MIGRMLDMDLRSSDLAISKFIISAGFSLPICRQMRAAIPLVSGTYSAKRTRDKVDATTLGDSLNDPPPTAATSTTAPLAAISRSRSLLDLGISSLDPQRASQHEIPQTEERMISQETRIKSERFLCDPIFVFFFIYHTCTLSTIDTEVVEKSKIKHNIKRPFHARSTIATDLRYASYYSYK